MKGWWRSARGRDAGVGDADGRPGDRAEQAKPEGEMRFALYVTLAPAWLDPGEATRGCSRRSGCCTRCTTRW